MNNVFRMINGVFLDMYQGVFFDLEALLSNFSVNVHAAALLERFDLGCLMSSILIGRSTLTQQD